MNSLKQTFINNGYSNACFDRILNDYVNRIHKPTEKPDITTHDLFYCNQFSSAYKTDERVIKQIVQNNTRCINPNEKLNLIVYYTSKTTTSLICLNNQSPKCSELQRTNVVYEFTCKTGDCERQKNSYIGMTTTTLSRRLTMHKSSGAIQAHMKSRHNRTVTREELEDNTEILRAETDFIRLRILEALYIQEKCPTLNQQATGNQRTLKLHNFPHTQNHTRQLPFPTNHTPDPHTPDAPPP